MEGADGMEKTEHQRQRKDPLDFPIILWAQPPMFSVPRNTPATIVISSISKAKLFQIFANNSTLDDSGFVPPSPPPFDYFMPSIKVLRNDVFHALADLNPQKTYGPNGSLLLFSRTVLPCFHLAWPNSQLCLSTSTFPSCWKFASIQPVLKKKMTVLIPQTTVLKL
ncbi:hypothetical protein E2C01_063434 [Portunus trituberculatus]|uniref:Uncharacterized protein n=1 Tax=Portunus trituberculatus TaxID=210409 RepID=A0A5B7HIY4_PORTR|nr:hypothetical protein [Portunus trituberculatus]